MNQEEMDAKAVEFAKEYEEWNDKLTAAQKNPALTPKEFKAIYMEGIDIIQRSMEFLLPRLDDFPEEQRQQAESVMAEVPLLQELVNQIVV
jgi:hypothetical protein